MAKRKRSGANDETPAKLAILPPPSETSQKKSKSKRASAAMNPDKNAQIIDAPSALRASPDGDENARIVPENINGFPTSESPLSDFPDAPEVLDTTPKKQQPNGVGTQKHISISTIKDRKVEEMMTAAAARKNALKAQQKPGDKKEDVGLDPEADEEDEEADPEEVKEALSRPPPVNSDYLPLPWKGRIGYACLCTYLRYSNPPVFQSRTTRIASILEHRHPLKDSSKPEHPTKNRPDKEQPPDIRRGQKFVEQLCLANVKDMGKMIRWNDKYGIKFMRLSSEAFPFASHADYGYKLAPFASEALAEVGKIAARLGHRLTTHPGQFTQLGSPRESVIKASIKDLEYHDEFLSLLKLPEQQDKDAVMILHMGGVFGDKTATLDRFRENYKNLSQGVKNRLVLENDDVSWSVHDLLPICKELNIPFVLDYHHHNIIFDSAKIREGTKDIMSLYDEIRATWTRKGITQKMHYSEPTPAAITPKQRRKHSPRVATLPPCANDMDLMIEAKDKEQAVFELMRNFKLPGYDRINDMLPYIRKDDNKPTRLPKKKTPKKGKKGVDEEDIFDDEAIEDGPTVIPEEDVGMGGPENRVYWPPGMEEWLRPVKKVVAKKESFQPKTMEQRKADKAARLQAEAEMSGRATKVEGEVKTEMASPDDLGTTVKVAVRKRKPNGTTQASRKIKREATPSTSDDEAEEILMEDLEAPPARLKRAVSSRKSSRAKAANVIYHDMEEE